jgi:restriction system protein
MPIPDFQTIMLPLLKLAGDNQEHSLRQVIDTLTERFGLTEKESRELLPSGRQAVMANRVGWAKSYLVQAGLLEITRRGYFQITPRGSDVLSHSPKKIDIKYLEQFSEFQAFRNKSALKRLDEEEGPSADQKKSTPEEVLDAAHQELRSELSGDLLTRLKQSPPDFFERVVIDVLLKMGYGGSRQDAGEAVGRSGDGGIDGIIKEDRLGLDVLYIQAKRWEGVVGRPEIQKFVGALHGRRARKGVFITTSSFSQEAIEYAATIDSKIILIDGDHLTNLMIDFDVGVTTSAVYEVKSVDFDYFVEN